MARSSLEELKLQNSEVIQKYQNTWTKYHTKYESSEMAAKLSGIKTAALKLQNEGICHARDWLVNNKKDKTEIAWTLKIEKYC